MKLVSLKVSNYRSFWGSHSMTFAESGTTCLVGPNNVGKSNLIGALELCLTPRALPDPARDLPQLPSLAQPRQLRIECTFQSAFSPDDRVSSPERTLLRRARDYERGAYRNYAENRKAAGSTHVRKRPLRFHASQGLIVWNALLQVRGGVASRYDFLSVPGIPASMAPSSRNSPFPDADSREHAAVFRELSRNLLFVPIRSGESLRSFLSGPFREVLEQTMAEHLSAQVTEARGARERYQQHLQDTLLLPLSRRIGEVAAGMFPGVSAAELIPSIPALSETLSSMDVRMRDVITSDMRLKGTGLRAGVLAAALAYLREGSSKSMIFAVEEPESFLHPAAQEDLRDALSTIASQPDVTMLITTHSPFMVPRPATGITWGVDKDSDGRSQMVRETAHRHPAETLYRDGGLHDVIGGERAIDSGCDFVVLTEGKTDFEYMQIAAAKVGREDLTARIQFVSVGGAVKMPAEAVLYAQLTRKPVIVLLDSDDDGQKAAKRLKNFRSQPNRSRLMIGSLTRKGLAPRVVEDLWPDDLIMRMRRDLGNPDAAAFKSDAPEWCRKHAYAEECGELIRLLEALHAKAAAVREGA